MEVNGKVIHNFNSLTNCTKEAVIIKTDKVYIFLLDTFKDLLGLVGGINPRREK